MRRSSSYEIVFSIFDILSNLTMKNVYREFE